MSSKREKIARSLFLSQMLENNHWHSSIGFDSITASSQKNKEKMTNNEENRKLFIAAGNVLSKERFASSNDGNIGDLLIHKATKALWKISDNGKMIEPAFGDDIITIGEQDE